MSDCTSAAIILLRPVEHRLRKCHGRCSKPDQRCARPAGHVCEVDVGDVEDCLHHIEKGCVKEAKTR